MQMNLKLDNQTMELPHSIRFNGLLCRLIVIALVKLSVSLSVFQGQDLPYMTSDVNEVSGKYFDYIVIGGGTAGCALAATLSEKFSVLVVERGGSPYGNPLTLKQNTGRQLLLTDEYSSIAQSFISKDGVSNFRGRVLGGSSAINFGFYSRASDESIADAGWDAELVKEAYEWVESKIVYKQDILTNYQTAIALGLIEAEVLPFNGFTWEHIVGTKIGGAIFDQLGVRHTAADLLRAGNSKNIRLLLNATAKNIIFHKSGKHRSHIHLLNNEKLYRIDVHDFCLNDACEGDDTIARGVRFIKSDGSTNQTYEAYIKKPFNSSTGGEVILSAGALGSPQILLLSGIGPENHLQRHSIPVVLNLEGVGREIQDNPAIAFMANSNPGYMSGDPPQVAGIAKDFEFIVQSGFLFTSLNETSLLMIIKFAFPASRGQLTLNNADPRQNPLVEFNYLEKGKDLDKCVRMVRLLNKISSSWSLSGLIGSQPTNISLSDTKEVRKYCKQNVRTYYHYHGGCNVGRVIDADYRVFGVKGLRVVDGSTFWTSPGTNPMATVLMLGRYQAIKILRERENFS